MAYNDTFILYRMALLLDLYVVKKYVYSHNISISKMTHNVLMVIIDISESHVI